MSYRMKNEISEEIRKKRCNRMLAKEIGITETYISQIVNKRRTDISKTVAYAVTKAIGSDLEIKDIFEVF